MTEYLSVADTAKLVRQSLKEAFPGVKFSVRSSSYSGGASISIAYTDGPNAAQVKAVISPFEGSYFDGMIDYKGSVYASLDGKEVRFGADFIFVNREYSDALIERAFAGLKAKSPGNFKEFTFSVADFRQGKYYNVFPYGGDWSGNNSLQSEMNAALSKRSTMLAKASATAARAKVTGDDGYGQGTVGRDGKGGEGAYKAMEAARERQAAISEQQAVSQALSTIPSLIAATALLNALGGTALEKPEALPCVVNGPETLQ